MPSKLSNGKYVAKNYDSRLYVAQEKKRGDPDYVLSRSELVEFSKCPSRWRRGYKENEDGTDATDYGSLVDCLLFEPERLLERFVVKPATYPSEKDGDKPWNANSKWCKEWLADHADKIPIRQDSMDEANRATARFSDDPALKSFLGGADFQVYVTAEYCDPKTGVVVPLKSLIDVVPKGEYTRSLGDLKTARNASTFKWNRIVFDRHYHTQAAMFLDVYNAATGENRDEFRHIVQENYDPFEISKPILSDDFISLGRSKYMDALKRYCQCIKSNVWPGYDDLSDDSFGGWSMTHPEAYMVEASDPDWLKD